MLPELSIIIPSHNRPDLLQTCLRSVVEFAPARTQIVVVDDAGCREAVRSVTQDFAGVEVVRLPRRRGFCAAANAGIAAAKAPIVELLNDDTFVTAGWAATALEVFRDSAVAAVAPLVLCWPDGSRVDSAGDRYCLGGIAGKRGHGQRLGPELMQPCRVFGASASSAFYRREVLLRVGAFPESFGAYFEDVDLAFRIHRAGYEIRFEPASRVLHRGGASYGKLPGRRLLEQQSHNEEQVFWRNLPARTLRHALPRHLAVLAAKGWRRWQDGTLLPFVWGRLRVLRNLSQLLRHRRQLLELGPDIPEHNRWEIETRFWGSAFQ